MQPNRREFLSLAPAALAAAQAPAKPNFLIILADDMGYSDARCYGGDIDTPNLDRLAAQGLRFTQGYSTARCGPSRSCLLTGHYAQQTACDIMTPGLVPDWTRFAPQHLQPLGYRSYHSGKWHIRFQPLAATGFEHSYTLQDQNSFFAPRASQLDGRPLPPGKLADGYYATTAIGAHAVKFLEGHAREHPRDPFFLYLPFTAPHFPLHALQQDIDKYQDRFQEGWDQARAKRYARMRQMGLVNSPLAPFEPGIWPDWNLPSAELTTRIGAGEVTRAVPWATLTPEQKKFQRTKMAIHAAMIDRMDQEIGHVIGQLKAMNAFDNTVIVFVSDNGASAEQLIRGDGHDPQAAPGSAMSHLCLGPGWSTAANTPFRLHKSWVHEGGISSPWIMHWPKGITDRGKLRHTPCHLIDLVPTMLDLAGGSARGSLPSHAPPLAGRSLAPAFAKDVRIPRDYLYFHHNKNRALRVGDHKLVAIGEKGPWALYDLAKDRGEQVDLVTKLPEKAREMASRWQQVEDSHVNTREAATPANFPRIVASRD
ncbi:MAG: arylsulfatase [Bryobacteraceae bacterium]|nr:arylsulfatase [Bryobacteraceae bacterium]